MKSNLTLVSTEFDKNGNKIARFKFTNAKRAFSIQLLGNLPKTHNILSRLTSKDIKFISAESLQIINKEAIEYIKEYGTLLQRKQLSDL